MKRLLVLPLLALALAACSDDDGADVRSIGESSGSASGSTATESCKVEGGVEQTGATVVHLTLDEWTIKADISTVKAGTVRFDAKNAGKEIHEVVLVKGAKADALTIDEDGLDEDALPADAEVVGELEAVPAGESCPGNFALTAGDYALVCNIVDSGHAHADEGMVASFTVN